MAKKDDNADGKIYVLNRNFRCKVKKVNENGKHERILHPETGVPLRDAYEEHQVTFIHRGFRMNGAEKQHEYAYVVDENTPKEVSDYLEKLEREGTIHCEDKYIAMINPERAIADKELKEQKEENKKLLKLLEDMKKKSTGKEMA